MQHYEESGSLLFIVVIAVEIKQGLENVADHVSTLGILLAWPASVFLKWLR